VEYEKNPAITRKRLYLEAKEKLYSSTNKIVVDTDQPPAMYLPMQQSISHSGSAPSSVVNEPELNSESRNSADKNSAHGKVSSNELRPSRSR
jgi:membrane protease subunit HflK